MKTFALACLLLALSACKKFDGGDLPAPKGGPPRSKPDTIPDHASFTLKLIKDSTDYDETAFLFDKKAGVAYNPDYDAEYLVGFGKVGLASLSGDGRALAINTLPYKPGMSIGLVISCKNDGMLNLEITRENNMPGGIGIWVKDVYANDSLDLCHGAYSFRVSKADTNSYGRRRLKLLLTNKPPMH